MPRPKLIYLVTEDWFFWQHRLPMARAARDAGFDVAVATRVAAHGDRIAAEGFRVLPLSWRRRSTNPFAALAAVAEIAVLYRRERPDIVHHVALKPVLLGGIAAAVAGVPAVLNGLTGLGSVFTDAGKRRLLRALISRALPVLTGRHNSLLSVENQDDRQLLIDGGMTPADQVVVIRGSGVDIGHFHVVPEPADGPVTVAYAGRMLADKGVGVLVEAHQALVARGVPLRLLLVGAPDPENPTSFTLADLERWRRLPMVECPGHVDDIRAVWAACHFAVLPSRREGLPVSLMEAAACGRALVATDVPGCREIAYHGRNALMVPPDDPGALATALETLALDADMRRRFAAESRRLVESDMAAERIGARTVELYRGLMASAQAGTAAVGQAGAP